ncbi:MAG: PAS domain S-box protein [Nitrospirae bacterium]|uniref:PAS domain S-box protein n=1 Tax=Candidatus Magnetobacterium casense TaxID=1455061 RepID=UPI000697202F|nr:PAS domain S-box protein [Candidatus Magnetobacterium casensis]MBF0337199.1 PAS domain S-box protein [Nitrospirota bacterium]
MANKGTILVVEDSMIQAEMLKRILQRHGYGVITASNGKLGLELALNNMPDLVISDIIMPVMNGYELCREIKNNENIKRIPVILLTELKSVTDILEGLESLSDDYITKPYSEDYLISKIESHIYPTIAIDNTTDVEKGFEVIYKGATHMLYTNYKKIFNLLISTYENAIHQYQEILDSRETLKRLNDELVEQTHIIKQSEEMFKFFVQTIPDVIYKIDIDGRFTFINNSIRNYGYEPEDLIGEHFSKIFNTEDVKKISRAEVLPHFIGKSTGTLEAPKLFDERRTVDRKTFGLEVHLKTKDSELSGKSIIAEVSSYGIYKFNTHKHVSDLEGTLGVIKCKQEDFLGSGGIIKDITEKRRTEKALVESEKMAQALMENACDAILIADIEGNLIDANKKAVKLLGYDKAELLHMKYTDIHPQNELMRVIDHFQGTVEKDLRDYIETQVLSKNGSNTFVEISASLIKINGKKLVQGIFRNITERKLSQERLRRQEQLLIQQSKMAAMGEMIGVISHQWKQPLNGLALIIQNLRDAREYIEIDDNYINNFVNDAMDQVLFMAKTIDEFRNFFKPSKEKETFNIMGVIGEIFSLLSPQLKNNAISYKITCNPHNKAFRDHSVVMSCNAILITTYKNQLAHVILNLISNSNDAIIERRQKGLLLKSGMISVDCYKENNLLKVEISDNGGGIPDEIIDGIFEPYFTTKKDKGTGIGLYMSKVIIEESLGGRIYAKNIEDGVMFILEFDVSAQLPHLR